MTTSTFTRSDLAAILVQECPHRGLLSEGGIIGKQSYCRRKYDAQCNAEDLRFNCPLDCPRLQRHGINCDGERCNYIQARIKYYIKHRDETIKEEPQPVHRRRSNAIPRDVRKAENEARQLVAAHAFNAQGLSVTLQ